MQIELDNDTADAVWRALKVGRQHYKRHSIGDDDTATEYQRERCANIARKVSDVILEIEIELMN